MARLNQDNYQNQELEIEKIENQLQNKSLPNIKHKEIYKSSTFNFKSHNILRTIESSISIKILWTVKLLKYDILTKYFLRIIY